MCLKVRLVLVAGALVTQPAAPSAADDGCAALRPEMERTRHAGERASVAYRPIGGKIEVGRMFSLEIAACEGGKRARSVRVDASMPQHRHGMNFKPEVTYRGDGRWVAEGMMFHMPGRWQLVIEVETSKGRERIERDLIIE